jgi:hypothetical protein
MSTAATPATPILKTKPTLTTSQLRSLKTLPENWREQALASPKNSTAVRAIAAAFAMLVDGEDAIAPLGRDGQPNVSATVADVKYGAGYHSRERVQFIIENSPATIRDMFSGVDARGVQKIHDLLQAKLDLGKHQEPTTVDRPRGTATVFELKYELYELLTNDDLEKVLKYALARLHPDNKETGNEVKYKRLGEVWSKIKDIEGV